MPFFTFPSAAVLVVRIRRFDSLQAGRTDKNPIALRFNPDAVEDVVGFFTAATWLGANSLDPGHQY